MKRGILIFLGVAVKKNKKSFKTVKNILFTLFLALICVGGVELAVCSYASPALYAQITDPVRAGLRRMAEVNEVIWTKLQTSASRAAQDASQRLQDAAIQFQDAAVQLQNAWEAMWTPPEAPEPDEDVQLVDDAAVQPPPRSQASYGVTAIASRYGREYLTGGAHEMVYFNQTDERWADEPYGSDRIGGYGCGPTVMAMVAATLADADTDPAQMAQRCVELGYWASKHGSYHAIVQGISEEYGLKCTSLPPDEASEPTVFQYLASGQLIVALVGPGHFTNSGHFIILRGVTLDGSILVADPASQERSLTTWDLSLILEELSSHQDSGGPLWVISSSFL